MNKGNTENPQRNFGQSNGRSINNANDQNEGNVNALRNPFF